VKYNEVLGKSHHKQIITFFCTQITLITLIKSDQSG